jgi:hypothetical protein
VRKSLVLVLPVLLSCLLLAQYPQRLSYPTKDLTALTAATASLTAMGNPATALVPTEATGTITFAGGRKGSVTLKSTGPKDLESTVSVEGDILVFKVSDGQGFTSRNGKRSELPAHIATSQGPEFLPAFSRLALANSADINLKYVATEELDGHKVHHLRLTNLGADSKQQALEDASSEFHAFIDLETNLVVKTNTYLLSPDTETNRALVETYYSDYRQVNGVAVPFKISRSIAGQKNSEIAFDQVIVNGISSR